MSAKPQDSVYFYQKMIDILNHCNKVHGNLATLGVVEAAKITLVECVFDRSKLEKARES